MKNTKVKAKTASTTKTVKKIKAPANNNRKSVLSPAAAKVAVKMDTNPGSRRSNKDFFTKAAESTAAWTGRPAAFLFAFSAVIIWACCGPFFHYSDTWQLVINTSTTIITFLMVFLIQNTQNRDIKAVHLKLSELIRATEGAHTILLDMEGLSEKELESLSVKYGLIATEARKRMRKGGDDTDMPEVLLNPKIAPQ